MTHTTWQELEAGAPTREAAALTVGVFDGLHIGHQRLIRSVTRFPGCVPVVVTFSRHPAEVLPAGVFPGYIMSTRQKLHTLENLGVGAVVSVQFSTEISRMSCADFLDTLLVSFDVRHAGIGYDFRCGGGTSMNSQEVRAYLEANGVEVDLVEAVHVGDSPVSSTRVREHIRAGRMRDASALMARPFSIDVTDEQPVADGPGLRFPLDRDRLMASTRQIVPAAGSYTVQARAAGFSADCEMTVEHNSVCLPLAPDDRIRYIVVQENRD